MQKKNKQLMKKTFRSILLVLLTLLFVTGNALATSPFASVMGNTPDIPVTDATGWDDENRDKGDIEPYTCTVLECIAVTGITEVGIDFVVVPANIPGPGENEYSHERFMESILDNGFTAEANEKAITTFWGTKKEVSDGLKVYKETVTYGTTTDTPTFAYTLIKDTTVEMDDCSGTGIIPPEEICVEVTGVAGTDFEFVIGGGSNYQGESMAFYFGSEEQLANSGLKVYKYEFDETILLETMDLGELLAAVKLTLISNTTIKKIECPEPFMEDDNLSME